jgi:hypothetical protein
MIPLDFEYRAVYYTTNIFVILSAIHLLIFLTAHFQPGGSYGTTLIPMPTLYLTPFVNAEAHLFFLETHFIDNYGWEELPFAMPGVLSLKLTEILCFFPGQLGKIINTKEMTLPIPNLC